MGASWSTTYFYDDRILDQQVEAIRTIQLDLSVGHRQRLLSYNLEARLREFEGQTGFICAFEKARSQRLVHGNCTTHYALCNTVEPLCLSHLASVSSWHDDTNPLFALRPLRSLR